MDRAGGHHTYYYAFSLLGAAFSFPLPSNWPLHFFFHSSLTRLPASSSLPPSLLPLAVSSFLLLHGVPYMLGGVASRFLAAAYRLRCSTSSIALLPLGYAAGMHRFPASR